MRARVLVVAVSIGLLSTNAPGASSVADDHTGPYVALGDSYTAGPMLPDPVGEPGGCGRSTRNYPALVARELGSTRLIDASCGGATTENLTRPQFTDPLGINDPQLDRLDADTRIVTLGIGSNDAQLLPAATECMTRGAEIDPAPDAAPCADVRDADGRDRLATGIAAVGPRLARALAAVHERAPRARVLVVGYPTLVPTPASTACRVALSLTEGDVAYLDARVRQLNTELREAAESTDAVFVDIYPASIGHDACAPTRERWVEPLVPAAPAFPLHPNASGMAAAAAAVTAAIRDS